MELIDIIKSTISIFSAIVIGSIAISYAIYKIKNHSHIKPYLRLNEDNSLYGTILNHKDLERYTNIEKSKHNGNKFNPNNSLQNKFNLINSNNRISRANK